MFDKLFNKDAAPPPAESAPPRDAGAELHAWRERILSADGDDVALLQLAHEAPGVELKLSALAALKQEEVLRQATREFRDHDKRLYRAAKSGLEAAVARREALAQAPVLIAGARNLLEQETIPANRLVELDRAWAALAGALLTVVADLVARTAVRPLELPVGAILAIVGGPYFLFLLFRRIPA